jgi:hypothetical protein
MDQQHVYSRWRTRIVDRRFCTSIVNHCQFETSVRRAASLHTSLTFVLGTPSFPMTFSLVFLQSFLTFVWRISTLGSWELSEVIAHGSDLDTAPTLGGEQAPSARSAVGNG